MVKYAQERKKKEENCGLTKEDRNREVNNENVSIEPTS